MDKADTMRFCQRRRDLAQNVDDPAGGLRTVKSNQILQVQALEVLHCVVKDTVWRSAVIEDRNGIHVRQQARELHLAFEAIKSLGSCFFDRQQLHCSWAAQHGVLGAIYRAHAPFAYLLEESVLSKLPRLTDLLAQTVNDVRGQPPQDDRAKAPKSRQDVNDARGYLR